MSAAKGGRGRGVCQMMTIAEKGGCVQVNAGSDDKGGEDKC